MSPRSKLFTLQARQAAAQVALLARDVHAQQAGAQRSRDMQARVGALLASLAPPTGPEPVPFLRDRTRLAATLQSEQERQSDLEAQALARAHDLRTALNAQMRKQQQAGEAAQVARRAEADIRSAQAEANLPPRPASQSHG
jgi:hypothetical protein